MRMKARRRFGRSALLLWGAALVLALSAGTCDATAPAYVPPEGEDPDKDADDSDKIGFLLIIPDGGSLLV